MDKKKQNILIGIISVIGVAIIVLMLFLSQLDKKVAEDDNTYTITLKVYYENDELVSFYVCTDAEGEFYYVETVGANGYTEANGYTYIKYTQEEIEALGQADFTEYVKQYLAANKVTDTSSELYGCVKVDEKFATVLGLLMDKYTFPDVEYSWVKLCYYYKYYLIVCYTIPYITKLVCFFAYKLMTRI